MIAAGDVVPAKKPAPDIYNFAGASIVLNQLGEPGQPFTLLAAPSSMNGARVIDLMLARSLI